MRHMVSFLCCLGAVMLTVAGMASPSGLAVIPTADVLESGQFCGSVATRFTESRSEFFINTEVGVLGFAELGVDYGTDIEDVVGNLKVATPAFGGQIAVGVGGVGDEAEWFLVYSSQAQEDAPFRFHAGIFDNDEKTDPFVGFEYTLDTVPVLDREVTLLLEYVETDEDFISIGAAFTLVENIDVLAAYIIDPPEDVEPTNALSHGYLEIGCVYPF